MVRLLRRAAVAQIAVDSFLFVVVSSLILLAMSSIEV